MVMSRRGCACPSVVISEKVLIKMAEERLFLACSMLFTSETTVGFGDHGKCLTCFNEAIVTHRYKRQRRVKRLKRRHFRPSRKKGLERGSRKTKKPAEAGLETNETTIQLEAVHIPAKSAIAVSVPSITAATGEHTLPFHLRPDQKLARPALPIAYSRSHSRLAGRE